MRTILMATAALLLAGCSTQATRPNAPQPAADVIPVWRRSKGSPASCCRGCRWTVAENEAGGTDGSYLNAPSLGNTALYVGGPTSMHTTGSNKAASFPVSGIPATMEQMTLGVIVKPAALTGLRHLVNRDNDAGGGRRWQFRLNGSSVQFVKIPGSAQTVSATHGMSVGQAHLLMVTITAGGTVKLFGNGALLGSGSVTPLTNYGGGGLDMLVANRGLLTEGTDNTYSEAFLIFGGLEDARVAQYGAAVGLP